ncbi:MAG TPA: helix-turn-helix transcriptional regulator [Thermoanaerobaculia bacterium]|nr:helix-turn-helix transcriptional regulator [Thermoanaerobaculia bacterium]
MSTSNRPHPAAPSLLSGLGQALRWLRERQSRKQYQLADAAGITKGMLSAYETGRQRPSLETLDKLLATLACDLNDLHNALQIVNGRPEWLRGWHERRPAGLSDRQLPGMTGMIAEERPWYGSTGPAAPAAPAAPDNPWRSESSSLAASAGGPASELRDGSATGVRRLAPEEERALEQMLAAFQGLIHYWHDVLVSLLPPLPEPSSPSSAGSVARPSSGSRTSPGSSRRTSAASPDPAGVDLTSDLTGRRASPRLRGDPRMSSK